MSHGRKLESWRADSTYRCRYPSPALPSLSTRANPGVAVRSIRLRFASARARGASEAATHSKDLFHFAAPRVCEVPEIRRPQALMMELVGFTKGTDGTHAALQPRVRSGPCALSARGPQSQEAGSSIAGRRRQVSADFLVKLPAVRCGLDGIMRQAFIRKGLGPLQIGADEAEYYLLEAERSRGVMPGCGEILAIFRRMPIELVSSMRFDDRSRILAYTLVPMQGMGRSRIHDVALVRDRSTGKTRWIPHWTSFQTATLC